MISIAVKLFTRFGRIDLFKNAYVYILSRYFDNERFYGVLLLGGIFITKASYLFVENIFLQSLQDFEVYIWIQATFSDFY